MQKIKRWVETVYYPKKALENIKKNGDNYGKIIIENGLYHKPRVSDDPKLMQKFIEKTLIYQKSNPIINQVSPFFILGGLIYVSSVSRNAEINRNIIQRHLNGYDYYLFKEKNWDITRRMLELKRVNELHFKEKNWDITRRMLELKRLREKNTKIWEVFKDINRRQSQQKRNIPVRVFGTIIVVTTLALTEKIWTQQEKNTKQFNRNRKK